MKYVMLQIKGKEQPLQFLPVIFPEVVNHKDVAEAMQGIKVTPEGPFAGWWVWPRAVSAGFYLNGSCSGYSEGLKLGAHPEDTEIIKSFDTGINGFGFEERT